MQHRKRRTKVRRFRILIGFFVAKKLEKASFSKKQFFHARGDISEMQQSSLMDWCDSNTEAKAQILKVQQKEVSMAEQAAKRQQMWDSLQRLAELPDDTKVYCAHEYTASNARFALSVDDAPALKARTGDIFAARERGEWTVPPTIGLEKATNPFLRAPQLAGRLGLSGAADHEAFAAVRAAKDSFKG